MGGQNGGEKPANSDAMQAELAAMRARLDQMSEGRRSEFETAFIDGMRAIAGEQMWPCLSRENPPLTAADAREMVKWYRGARERVEKAEAAFKLYNDMRAVLGVMLDKLPELPDQRFDPGAGIHALPEELKNVKQ